MCDAHSNKLKCRSLGVALTGDSFFECMPPEMGLNPVQQCLRRHSLQLTLQRPVTDHVYFAGYLWYNITMAGVGHGYKHMEIQR